ncbi:MAG: hypothetical protein JO190_11075 [Candidatus Eremiobacteraeota bacterium]|nr:hypothetical protein [Candidatus Eremiobacteraeota bacterium]MBV8498142.1 hypothetical protein [Candidatus Eremiobacteraeota bacterium]
MAEGLVVGIFPQSDPKALASALSAQQIDLSKVKVVSGGPASDETDSSPLEFIDVATDMESNSLSDDMTHGMGIMGDSGGTSVPGIGGHQQSLESFTHRDATSRYLMGFAIPPDEVDNFDEAIAGGRAVVLYPGAGADAQAVATAFRAAGLRNVRSY